MPFPKTMVSMSQVSSSGCRPDLVPLMQWPIHGCSARSEAEDGRGMLLSMVTGSNLSAGPPLYAQGSENHRH